MAAHIKTSKGLSQVDLLSSQVIDSDTTTLGASTGIHAHANQVIAISTVSSRTDGTYTVTIEHSPDGSSWYEWEAGAAQSANGSVQIHTADNKPIFQYVRASVLSASTSDGATVVVSLYHGTQR